MRISELTQRSGVPIHTIKYYLREGLLHSGALSSPNQASYDGSHTQRLLLIRALLEVGGLPIATIRDVLAATDDSVHAVLNQVSRPSTALMTQETSENERGGLVRDAILEVDALVVRAGWAVDPTAPARVAAADVLAWMRATGRDQFADQLGEYADVAELLANLDLQALSTLDDTSNIAETALIGIVLGDMLVSALRRLAIESLTANGSFNNDR